MKKCPICNQELMINPVTEKFFCNNNNCCKYDPIDNNDYNRFFDRLRKINSLEEEILVLYQPLVELSNKKSSFKTKQVVSGIIFFGAGYIFLKGLSSIFQKENLGCAIVLFVVLIGAFIYLRKNLGNSYEIDTEMDQIKDKIFVKIYEIQKIDLIGRKSLYFRISLDNLKKNMFHNDYREKIKI
jgi:hypothetical protein